ncbi:hypothetical protein D9611_014598 [Ephemerocybe angulata]|uniref:Uncharacterized protein n=1 Tax=Ephemerocybe angulata TaxID=980116 RepID=A0A8H5CCW5_9AGAR|nr:hypothetical protein D9611_014598 [Tulosesus angulatus]
MHGTLLIFGVLAFVCEVYASVVPWSGSALMTRQSADRCLKECTPIIEIATQCYTDASSNCGCDTDPSANYKACAECTLMLAAQVKSTEWLKATGEAYQGTYGVYQTWCTAAFGLTIPAVTITAPAGAAPA